MENIDKKLEAATRRLKTMQSNMERAAIIAEIRRLNELKHLKEKKS